MAITNNGTNNLIPAGKLPSGHTRETATTFQDFEYTRTMNLSVLKATVDEATSTATMAAIIANGTIGVTKQITDICTTDFVNSEDVVIFADLTDLTTTIADMTPSGSETWLKDTAVSYTATVTFYVKST